MDKNEREDSRM